MSRRARAIAFLGAAIACALLAAAVAAHYRSRVEGRYGPLRPVVVAAAALRPGRPLGPEDLSRDLAIRRVPASFAPPTALARPADALGRAAVAVVPAGSYVLGAQLEVPRSDEPAIAGVGGGLRPVEVRVIGAGALTVAGGSPEGSKVDVVVSQSPGLGRKAHTYIAAREVPLLALDGPGGPGEGGTATLALTRSEALRLISAESSARQIRLLPRPSG
jgi:Flp pilus assembly protein CpaB